MLDTDVVSIGRKQFKGLIPPYKYRKAETHIPLSSANTDPFHAIVEKNHVQCCFILRDLNTTFGTYVNDHKLQNKAIRLLPGDIIRFGHDESTYEFGIINEPEGRQSVKSFVGRGKVLIETGKLEDLQLKRRSSTRFSSGNLFSSTSGFGNRPDSAPLSRTPSTASQPINLLLRRRVRSVPIKLRSGSRQSQSSLFGVKTTQSAIEPSRTQEWICPKENSKPSPSIGEKVGVTQSAMEPLSSPDWWSRTEENSRRASTGKKVYFKKDSEKGEEPW